jgi:hypothetical protein
VSPSNWDVHFGERIFDPVGDATLRISIIVDKELAGVVGCLVIEDSLAQTTQ